MRKMAITFFGLGFMPFATGSWGSAGAAGVFVAAWYAMLFYGGMTWGAFQVVILAVIALSSVLSIVWGKWACDTYGPDPKEFVLDEVAGQWVSLLWMPIVMEPGMWRGMWIVVAVQFFSFRLFDVIKPPPARQFERLKDGYGVLLDDLMAGVYANIVGQLIFRYFWTSFQ
jgi:phosphatidylglycerophosphatase A